MSFLGFLRSRLRGLRPQRRGEPRPDPDAELDIGRLLAGNAYFRRRGRIPWTFFAYPTAIAGEHGLPPHGGAVRYLAAVQSAGIDVTVWTPDLEGASGTTYFGCKDADRVDLTALVRVLESDDWFGPAFVERWHGELGAHDGSGATS